MLNRRLLPRRVARALALALCAAVSAIAQSAADHSVRVTLLQLNDVYQISPVDQGTHGGLARVAALRKKALAESPHTLLLLAGDTLSPSVASHTFKGRQMIAVWNAVGLDYAALGNHEFDFGSEALLDRMRESRFTWLGANVIDRRTGKPFGGTPPYVLREFDGAKIGFFGLVTPDTKRTSKPGPEVEFLDPLETAARLVSPELCCALRWSTALAHSARKESQADSPKSPACGLRTMGDARRDRGSPLPA